MEGAGESNMSKSDVVRSVDSRGSSKRIIRASELEPMALAKLGKLQGQPVRFSS